MLRDILARLSDDDLGRAGQLIGRTGEFDSSVSALNAARPAEWRWTFASAPASLEAEILDSGGRVVARPAVTPGVSGSLQWDGRLADGGRAPDGAYVLRLVGKDKAGAALAADVTSLGTIGEVMKRQGELWAGLGSAALPMDKLVRVAA